MYFYYTDFNASVILHDKGKGCVYKHVKKKAEI